MDPRVLQNKNKYVGKRFQSKYSGEFATVIEYKDSRQVVIEFEGNGITKELSMDRVRRGCFRDTTKPTVDGFGIKDVDYLVERKAVVDGKRKTVWICPYYRAWRGVISRSVSQTWKKKSPTYEKCTIHPEWQYLSNFIKWVDSQPVKNWQDCELDKDLIVTGNKHYSPETCCFIEQRVNTFLTDCGKVRGDYPLGVNIRDSGRFSARCGNQITGTREWLGTFDTPLEAHKAWQTRKHELACELAKTQSDPRVAKALRERYAPDKDWSKY